MSEITPMHTVGAELRIITAGPTGFENDLRREESIELIRARTALDAIGELANPIDELSPSGTALLVGPDAITMGEAEEFLKAVRKITPDAKVVLISDAKRSGEGFDAVVSPGAATDRLWRVLGISQDEPGLAPAPIADAPTPSLVKNAGPIGLVEPPSDPEPPRTPGSGEHVEVHTRPVRPASPKPETASEPTGRADTSGRNTAHSTPTTPVPPSAPAFTPIDSLDEALLTVIRDETRDGDADLEDAASPASALEAALAGDDTLRAGLAELRTELGTPTVRFTSGDTAEQGEPVQRGGRIFGALRADGVDNAALTRSAQWLASRLAIDEQLRALREAAFTDELTGAWNRRFFARFLDRSITRARAERQDLTLMFFDIDDFKTYNDRYGHGAGDEILVEVVRLLVAVIRPHDRVCRVGGDEFAVIFADGPREASSRHPSSIETIARRFQRQICEHRFPKLGADAMGTLTISGGLATFPWEAYDAESLIELADQLAMQSKRAGKNVLTMGPGADGVCEALEPDGTDGD